PYEYDFGDGNGFVATPTLNGLDTGDYTVIVRDDSGCTTTLEAIELDDRALNITVGDITNPTCGDLTNGSIEISADNAVGVLTFDFNDGNGPLDPTSLNVLDAGTYIIDVFDSEGCTSNPVEFTLTKPEPINGILEARRSSCNGANDGTAIITPTGGVPDYTYLWSNGATTRSVSNLAPGTYTVTVTDANGCTYEATSTPITDPPVLTASVASVQDVSCPGEANGQIELMVNGGTMPYLYSLDGILFQDGTTLTDLAIGDYDIIVADNNGCTVMVSASINSPATISFDVSSTTNICYGEPVTFTNTSVFTQGNITSVTWDFGAETATGDNPTTSFTSIGNPTVTLTIMTDLGCETELTQVLDIAVEPCCDQDNGVSFIPFFEDPLCNGSTEGIIILNPFSIVPITNIEWDNNENTEILENLPAGAYTVTVTNDATCVDSITIVLEEPNPINATFDLTNPTCDVATNGAIMIEATGGTLDPNGTYDFDFGDGFSTENTQANLAFGNFSIDIRDDNNCIVTVDTDLIVPDTSPINVSLNLVPPTCEAAFNGAIAFVATGSGSGIGANFVYDFGDGFTPNNSSENLAFGDYSLTVRDADNCTLTIDTTLTVSEIPPITAAIAITPVSCEIATNGSIRVNATGNSDLMYNFGTGFSAETVAENLPLGDYAIRIRDMDNCELTIDTTLAVSDVPPITANVAISRPSCAEATNGRITIDAVGIGNNMDLVYDFGNGFDIQNASDNLPVGDYSVTVQDRDNCTLSIDTSLTVDPDFVPITATFTNITQPSCGGG
ncbi:MAG: PKD domain-containing protein, partial [Saprospiraceae bacterium]